MNLLIQAIRKLNPKTFSVQLDGREIYRGTFTKNGIETVIDNPVATDREYRLMSIFLDDDPIPTYSIDIISSA